MSSYLDDLKKKAPVTNPAVKTLSFNGLKGAWKIYDLTVDDVEKRTTQLKEKKIDLVLLKLAKKFKFIRKAKGAIPKKVITTNLFSSYQEDVLRIYEDGSEVAKGTYFDIQDILKEKNCKVSDVYFGIDVKRGEPIMVELKGEAKAMVRKALKKVGGFQNNPFVSLEQGELVKSDDLPDYYRVKMTPLETDKIPSDILELIEEIGPKYDKYFEIMAEQKPQEEKEELIDSVLEKTAVEEEIEEGGEDLDFGD